MRFIEAVKFAKTGVIPAITGGFFFNPEAADDLVLCQFYALVLVFVIPVALCVYLGDNHRVLQSAAVAYTTLLALSGFLAVWFGVKLHTVLDSDGNQDETKPETEAPSIAHSTHSSQNGDETDSDDVVSDTAEGAFSSAILNQEVHAQEADPDALSNSTSQRGDAQPESVVGILEQDHALSASEGPCMTKDIDYSRTLDLLESAESESEIVASRPRKHLNSVDSEGTRHNLALKIDNSELGSDCNELSAISSSPSTTPQNASSTSSHLSKRKLPLNTDAVVAKFNFKGESDIDLSMVKGDVIILTDESGEQEPGWFAGEIMGTGRRGRFPIAYVNWACENDIAEKALSLTAAQKPAMSDPPSSSAPTQNTASFDSPKRVDEVDTIAQAFRRASAAIDDGAGPVVYPNSRISPKHTDKTTLEDNSEDDLWGCDDHSDSSGSICCPSSVSSASGESMLSSPSSGNKRVKSILPSDVSIDNIPLEKLHFLPRELRRHLFHYWKFTGHLPSNPTDLHHKRAKDASFPPWDANSSRFSCRIQFPLILSWQEICIKSTLVVLDNALDVIRAMQASLEDASQYEAEVAALNDREHKIISAINTLSRDNELVNVEELYRSGTLISETGEEDIADLNAAEALLMATKLSSLDSHITYSNIQSTFDAEISKRDVADVQNNSNVSDQVSEITPPSQDVIHARHKPILDAELLDDSHTPKSTYHACNTPDVSSIEASSKNVKQVTFSSNRTQHAMDYTSSIFNGLLDGKTMEPVCEFTSGETKSRQTHNFDDVQDSHQDEERTRFSWSPGVTIRIRQDRSDGDDYQDNVMNPAAEEISPASFISTEFDTTVYMAHRATNDTQQRNFTVRLQRQNSFRHTQRRQHMRRALSDYGRLRMDESEIVGLPTSGESSRRSLSTDIPFPSFVEPLTNQPLPHFGRNSAQQGAVVNAIGNSSTHRNEDFDHNDPSNLSVSSAESSTRQQPEVADYSDTSPGSLHFFEDENGHRVYYRFGDNGGIVSPPPPVNRERRIRLPSIPSMPTPSSGSLQDIGRSTEDQTGNEPNIAGDFERFLYQALNIDDESGLSNLLRTLNRQHQGSSHTYDLVQPVKKYTISIGGLKLRLGYDRAGLNKAFDRNLQPRFQLMFLPLCIAGSCYIAFQISFLVSSTATFFVWLVAATAQYSLFKSVHPDPGTSLLNERSTGYMRCIYFALLGMIFLYLDHAYGKSEDRHSLWGVRWDALISSAAFKNTVLVVILCLPLVWLFGHLPMWWRTLVHYILEQFDSVCFGGGGSKSLAGALCRFVLLICALISSVAAARIVTSDEPTSIPNVKFGAFQFVCTVSAYLLARCPADPRALYSAGLHLWYDNSVQTSDFGSHTIKQVANRLSWDPLMAIFYGGVFMTIHLTDVIPSGGHHLEVVLCAFLAVFGFIRYHVLRNVRQPHPWHFFKAPLINWNADKQRDHEKLVRYATFFERNLMYPLLVACGIVSGAPHLISKFGADWGAVFLAFGALRALRVAYSDTSLMWLSLSVASLGSRYDFRGASEGLLLDLLLADIIVHKMAEFVKKLGFAYVYTAPWNHVDVIKHPFHALMYPLTIPHAVMIVAQSAIATIFSAPVYPVAGSAIFLVSYFRPKKFFERRFTTKRLASTSDSTMRNFSVGATANNLNSIFYIQFHQTLRSQLALDIENGAFGTVTAGDMFILLNNQGTFHMTSVLHIIDVGHGYVSFQVRGLEFVGTFCQAREVEALEADDEWESDGMRCKPDRWRWRRQIRLLEAIMPVKLMADMRWRTWSLHSTNYVLQQGYSISLLDAQQYWPDLRSVRLFRSLMYKSATFYAIRHARYADWLTDENVCSMLTTIAADHVERGPHLSVGRLGYMDTDFDGGSYLGGVSLKKYWRITGTWVQDCARESGLDIEGGNDHANVPMHTQKAWHFMITVLIRRLLAAFMPGRFAVDQVASRRARTDQERLEAFFKGYHRLFEGRVDLESARCEWASTLAEFVPDVIVRAARTALRLFQDQLADPGCFDDASYLHETLVEYTRESTAEYCVAPETDLVWEESIANGVPHLLSFRHNIEESSRNDGFFVVRLVSSRQEYRVVRINEESFRGLWASQQQELLFFRNPNAERGSIQNAKCVLRNVASQSCDQPIGYPIFISEISHSFTNSSGMAGPLKRLQMILRHAKTQLATYRKTDASTRLSETLALSSTEIEMVNQTGDKNKVLLNSDGSDNGSGDTKGSAFDRGGSCGDKAGDDCSNINGISDSLGHELSSDFEEVEPFPISLDGCLAMEPLPPPLEI